MGKRGKQGKQGKRKSRNQRPSHAAKRARTDAEAPARYYIDAQSGMLRVAPYPHCFETYVKQRWIGRRLLEVFETEFGGYDDGYYTAALRAGTMRVDGRVVDPGQGASCSGGATDVVQQGHVLKNGEHIAHHVLRQVCCCALAVYHRVRCCLSHLHPLPPSAVLPFVRTFCCPTPPPRHANTCKHMQTHANTCTGE